MDGRDVCIWKAFGCESIQLYYTRALAYLSWRGSPLQDFEGKSPILHTSAQGNAIKDWTKVCAWNNMRNFYGSSVDNPHLCCDSSLFSLSNFLRLEQPTLHSGRSVESMTWVKIKWFFFRFLERSAAFVSRLILMSAGQFQFNFRNFD